MLRKPCLYALVLFAMLAGAQSARADELNLPPPHDWSGFYLGVHAGMADGKSLATTKRDTGLFFDENLLDLDSHTVGLHGGWNGQYGWLVYGLHLEGTLANMSGHFRYDTGDALAATIHGGGSLQGRLGLALDRFMIYGTGGLATTNVTMSEYDNATGLSDMKRDWLPGLSVGTGVEIAMGDRISARIEYRYSRFETGNLDLVATFPLFNVDHDMDVHAISAGLSWHF